MCLCVLAAAPRAGRYFFDIHPPLGKLLLAAGAWLAGYDPSVCYYADIGQVFDPACGYLALRITAGVCVCVGCVGHGVAQRCVCD